MTTPTTLDQITDEDFERLISFLKAKKFLVDGDLTPAGRDWLRSKGTVIPDDKSLVQIGLEALAQEVIDELYPAKGRRPPDSEDADE